MLSQEVAQTVCLPPLAFQTLDAQMVTALTRQRLTVSMICTGALSCMYFGFIFSIAYQKQLLAYQITSGLTLAIVFGALVVMMACLFTWAYGTWIARFDLKVHSLLEGGSPQ